MASSLVVDTCVLVHATENDESGQDFLDCLSIVINLFNNDDIRLAVDSNWEIMAEYERNIKKRTDHIATAIKEYVIDQTRKDQSEIVSYHPPLPNSQVEDLADLGFHSEDMKFVRVGPRSDLEMIVSTDGESFHNEEYKEWIESNLGVKVIKPDKCSEVIDNL